MALRVPFVLVNTLQDKVRPEDCDTITKLAGHSPQSAAQEAFPSCLIYVWNGTHWDPLDDATEPLLLKGGPLKVVQDGGKLYKTSTSSFGFVECTECKSVETHPLDCALHLCLWELGIRLTLLHVRQLLSNNCVINVRLHFRTMF
jgi:hypothetical protein